MESRTSSVVVVTPAVELAEADSEGDKPPAANLALVQRPELGRLAAFDLERVPMHLREIFIYAQRWGLSEPASRSELLARTTDGELRQVAEAVAPYVEDIHAWNATGESCAELDTYLALAEAHREIELALDT